MDRQQMRRYFPLFALALLFSLMAHLGVAPATAAPPAQEEPPYPPQLAIVFPHSSSGQPLPPGAGGLVNVSLWPQSAAHCEVLPTQAVMVARGNEPLARPAVTPIRVERSPSGTHFFSQEWNDIPVAAGAQYRFVQYGEMRPGYGKFYGNVWVHAADARTLLPEPLVPEGRLDAFAPVREYESRIQVVWPHDAQGNPAPVERATYVNVAVEVFERGTRRAVQPDAFGVMPFTLQLLAAPNNDPLFPVPQPVRQEQYSVGGQKYTRWVWNDVFVTPGEQIHFVVALLPKDSDAFSPYSTIWTHAADPRTILPNPTLPPCPGNTMGEIAYVAVDPSGAQDVYVLDVLSRATRRLTNDTALDGDMAWSPDGRRIAWTSGRNGQLNVWVMDANGSNARQLIDAAASGQMYSSDPTWSPDGQRIAYTMPPTASDPQALFIVNADGSNNQLRFAHQRTIAEPTWSPDGNYITFVLGDQNDSDLYSLDLRDSTLIQLTNTPTVHEAEPKWSPKGDELTYWGSQATGDSVYVIDNTGATRIIGDVTKKNFSPSFSPDARYLSFTRFNSEAGTQTLWIMDRAGINAFQLLDVTSVSQPVWKP